MGSNGPAAWRCAGREEQLVPPQHTWMRFAGQLGAEWLRFSGGKLVPQHLRNWAMQTTAWQQGLDGGEGTWASSPAAALSALQQRNG